MSQPTPVVRIGNAQAFWGDRGSAAAEMLAAEPDLDFLTLDYLAEVSMSILARQRERDPAAGFAADFVDVVRSLAPYWNSGGRCRVIANAGGLNPAGCAAACAAALAECGVRPLRIAVVSGDDVLEPLRAANSDAAASPFNNLDTGAPLSGIRERLLTANAYLGAEPIVAALRLGADIVITGRVADPSLVVAPCAYHFGWEADDWDRLAAATVAGHLIECGTQVTGGICTDWLDVPDPARLGFPIVEVAADGSCIVTKPRGSGGRVDEWTVKEQLVYEIGDPGRYLSPDVTVSFLSLTVEDLGGDRVRVRRATGSPRPSTLKVSATYRDGWQAAGSLTICGADALAKARRCGEIVLQRVREAGYVLRGASVECLGAGEFAGGALPPGEEGSLREVVLRIAVESESRAAAAAFSKGLMPLVTAGPPGTTGYAAGRPRVHEVVRYWPCLIERGSVAPQVSLVRSSSPSSAASTSGNPQTPLATARPPTVASPADSQACAGSQVQRETSASPTRLRDVAVARSGDKGTSANVGVLARRPGDYSRLAAWLTAECVEEHFRPLGVESVRRYELPNLHGFNFILHGVLRNGLKNDAQGKALAQVLLDLPLPRAW